MYSKKKIENIFLNEALKKLYTNKILKVSKMKLNSHGMNVELWYLLHTHKVKLYPLVVVEQFLKC